MNAQRANRRTCTSSFPHASRAGGPSTTSNNDRSRKGETKVRVKSNVKAGNNGRIISNHNQTVAR